MGTVAEVELSSQDALKALERFVVENDELLALEERIGRFNIFDALGIARVEIRHSNFLAWLLDPAESHGQGALFLKAILMDLLAQTPPDLRPFSPVQLDGAELRGVDVRREWRNIDILITCEEPKFVIAIENKIDASAYNPFNEYEKAVREVYPDRKPMFVFLTTDGAPPPDDDWVPYSYAEIHRVLTRVRNTHSQAIGDDVLAFLDHYLRLIGSRFMDDPKIDELCKRIYRNHRQVIDLIVERARTNFTRIVQAITDEVQQRQDFQLVSSAPKGVFFVPKILLASLPAIRVAATIDPRAWIMWEFRCEEQGCKLYVYGCPTSDIDLRRRVLRRLTENPKEFGFRLFSRRIYDQWTQICRRTVLKWDNPEDVEPGHIHKAVTTELEKITEQVAGVAEALRPIFAEQATSAGSP